MTDSNPEPLIATCYKGPLAKGTSYPFGAELLSKELSGVPQYKMLQVGFHGEKSPDFLMSKALFPVVAVEYEMRQGSYSTSNCSWSHSRLEPNWQITVRPILSRNRRVFREYLDECGWALIRRWLTDQWPKNGRLGKARLIISACQNTNEIIHAVEESIMPAKAKK